MGLVYCCPRTLLSKLTSRGYCLVVGGFSLAVICGLLSSCGRVKHSVAGDSKLVEVFTVLTISGGGISILALVGSSLFVSGGTYQFAMCAQVSSKKRQRILLK